MKFTNKSEQYKKYKIGNWTYGQPCIIEWSVFGKLEIGKFCSISGDVNIFLGGEHNYKIVSTYPFKQAWNMDVDNVALTKGDVIIGNDVWIGRGVTILSGVTIGDGAVIGTNAVVSKSISPYSIAIGNPIREIKKRFDDKIIEKLLEIKWWNWSDEKIKQYIKKYGKDINKFLENS
jgi:acetyltransferase-like isoleucine patch superfamily enzyme